MAAHTLESSEIATPCPVADEILVARIRAGDTEAFDGLYERYFDRVYAFVARHARRREDTEEIVEAVLAGVFASINLHRDDSTFGAWVFEVTRAALDSRH